MQLSMGRIGWAALCAALAVAAIAWISRTQPKALTAKIDASWIPMPPDGMDASGFATRRLLLAAGSTPEDDALTRACGSHDSDGASERYRAVIGDPFVETRRQDVERGSARAGLSDPGHGRRCELSSAPASAGCARRNAAPRLCAAEILVAEGGTGTNPRGLGGTGAMASGATRRRLLGREAGIPGGLRARPLRRARPQLRFRRG